MTGYGLPQGGRAGAGGRITPSLTLPLDGGGKLPPPNQPG